jgi:hypothetical protein
MILETDINKIQILRKLYIISTIILEKDNYNKINN